MHNNKQLIQKSNHQEIYPVKQKITPREKSNRCPKPIDLLPVHTILRTKTGQTSSTNNGTSCRKSHIVREKLGILCPNLVDTTSRKKTIYQQAQTQFHYTQISHWMKCWTIQPSRDFPISQSYRTNASKIYTYP